MDVDLTVLSSTMVYSEVYNMLYYDPESYYGKTIKMTGVFSIYQMVVDGVTQPDPVAYACIIADATACCAQGMKFVLESDHTYPDDYPDLGTEITVIGEFQPYEENGMTWYNYDKPEKPRISRVFILFQTEKSSREVVIS